MRLPASFVAVVALLSLGGCQAPPRRAALPLPPPSPPAPPAQPREAAVWHFTSDQGSCTARAAGRTAQLRVTLRAGHTAGFLLFLPAEARAPGPAGSTGPASAAGVGALRFQGPAGSWSVTAQAGPGSRAEANLALNDQAVGRVALLLAGGTLTPVGTGPTLPALTLPPAGAAGRQWFACARGLLF